MMMNKIIKLREVKKSDLKYFLKWWKNKELIKQTSGHYENSDKVLTGYFLGMLKQKTDKNLLITLNSLPIGHLSIIKKSKTAFEFVIAIGEKRHWGRGYGSWAIKKALNLAFNNLSYKKAYLEVRPENARAIKAYEKCGFKKIGIKKYLKDKFRPVVLKMSLNKMNFDN